MTLSDNIYESFHLLLNRYKDDYKKGGYKYTHKVIFEELLFVLLKTLYNCDLPYNDVCCIEKVPSDNWIKNHIHLLLTDDDEEW